MQCDEIHYPHRKYYMINLSLQVALSVYEQTPQQCKLLNLKLVPKRGKMRSLFYTHTHTHTFSGLV